jgi:hypothetical protein
VIPDTLDHVTQASNEQYESIPDDEIVLLVRKFRVLHMFHKERRRSQRGRLRNQVISSLV